MLYMVVETYRNRDAVPVYRRFWDRGRLMPDGVRYVDSWVTTDLSRCFQVVECDDPAMMDQWTDQWDDLVDFQLIPVMTSGQARMAVEPRL